MTPLSALRTGDVRALRALLQAASPAKRLRLIRQDHLTHFAAVRGDIPMLRVLIRAGADLKSTDTNHWIPAFSALENGHLDALAFLIQTDSDSIDHRDSCDRTLLLWAADLALPDAVHLLLQAGADPHARDGQDHDTPLHRAVRSGCIRCAGLLLDAGADPNAKAKTGETPLAIAAASQPHLMDFLLRAGAKTEGKLATGAPFACAVEDAPRFHHGAYRLFRAGVPVHDSGPPDGNTRLHLATPAGRAHEVARLIACGANPNQTAAGKTPLHLAAQSGHHDCLRLLIRLGADLERPDAGNRTPLWFAAELVDREGVRILQEAGADPAALLSDLGWESACAGIAAVTPLSVFRWSPAQWEHWLNTSRHLRILAEDALSNPTFPDALRQSLLAAAG